jgi:hypothetical protein
MAKGRRLRRSISLQEHACNAVEINCTNPCLTPLAYARIGGQDGALAFGKEVGGGLLIVLRVLRGITGITGNGITGT